MIKFKPNILIELSISPETYSYTLSLKMITKLPIIYFKKTGNFTIEDRLSNYDKAYPFKTLEEFNKLIHIHTQNYFYTIKPEIYYNHFWDEFFLGANRNTNINYELNKNKYNFIYNKLNLINDEIINKYPILFHKYKYKLSNLKNVVNINIYNEEKFINEYITHIHCCNLDLFYIIFNELIDNCLAETKVIVTFSIKNNSIIDKFKNIIFLEISNKGYDIGGKICCLKYLYDKNCDYKSIFFLHSKSNDSKRAQYINPLVKSIYQIQHIKKMFYENINLLGVFPNLLIDCNKPENANFLYGTLNYREEILDYLKCKNKNNIFVEGNVMVLKKKIIDYIFYRKIEIFYNLLNDENDIDLNWMKYKYYLNKNIDHMSYKKILNNYLNNKDKYLTNDFQALKTNEALRDCMIEHVFERIWINIILELKGEFCILE